MTKENVFDRSAIVIVLILTSVIYGRYFIGDVHLGGDWNYYQGVSRGVASTLNAWDYLESNRGSLSIFMWRWPYEAVRELFIMLFGNTTYFDIVAIYIPIIYLFPYSVYKLAKSLGCTSIAASVASLFLVFSSYFQSTLFAGHALILVSFAFFLVAFSLYINAEGSLASIKLGGSALIFTIACAIDLRVGYMGFHIISAYLLTIVIFNRLRALEEIKKIIKYTVIVFLLNVYWIFPTIIGSVNNVSLIGSRTIFGSNYFDFIHAVAGIHPFWSWNGVEWFVYHELSYYFVIYLCASTYIFYVNRKEINAKFLYIILIAAIFLSKQNNQPIPQLYEYLFDLYPGFKAFREGSKFYLLTNLCFGIFIGILFDFLKNKTRPMVIGLMLVALFLQQFITIKTIVAQDDGPFAETIIPNGFHELEKLLTVNELSNYRILWIPAVSKFLPYNKLTSNMGFLNFISDYKQNEISTPEVIMSKWFDDFLYENSINYVVLPSDSDSSKYGFYNTYNEEKKYLLSHLKQKSSLVEVDIGATDYNLFRVVNTRPRMCLLNDINSQYCSNLDAIEEINPGFYVINPNNINQNYYGLYLYDSYSKDWLALALGRGLDENIFIEYCGRSAEVESANYIRFSCEKVFGTNTDPSSKKLLIIYLPLIAQLVGLIFSAIFLICLVIRIIYLYVKSSESNNKLKFVCK